MTIYATPFKHSDKQTTGPSTDSQFPTLAAVVDAMGPGHSCRTPRMVIYGGAEDKVVFSNFAFCIDDPAIIQ